MYREKIRRDNGTGEELSRSRRSFRPGKEEIQMDDREWWTEADKGSGQVGFLQRGVCSC